MLISALPEIAGFSIIQGRHGFVCITRIGKQKIILLPFVHIFDTNYPIFTDRIRLTAGTPEGSRVRDPNIRPAKGRKTI